MGEGKESQTRYTLSQTTKTFLFICPLSGWHYWEGGTIRTHKFELTHGGKLEEPLLHVCGLVNERISIAVERSYSCMIHGDLLPSSLWEWEPDWDPGSGLRLTQ